MSRVHVVLVTVLGVVLCGASVSGQDLSHYRGYVLNGTLASIAKAAGTRASDAKTLHERPAKIQELEWRPSFMRSGREPADPIRDVVFRFYDDQLFRIVIRYDRDRTEGLTPDDVIESIVGLYGIPILTNASASSTSPDGIDIRDSKIVAQWEDAAAVLTLFRGTYSREFQLVLISKALNAPAVAAMKEALRLDVEEAPRREIDLRARDAATARATQEKARLANKAAFRP